MKNEARAETRVLIAEDSPTMRHHLVNLINNAPGLRIVGEARDGEEVLALTGELKPDVISMDIRMPGIDGLEATRRIMNQYPTPVVVVSGLLDREIEAAQIAFDGTREEATLGARTTLDVLDSEQDLLNARTGRVDAAAEQQIAYYGLLSSMGRLTADYLGLPVTAYDPSVYYNSVRNAPAIGSEQGIQLDRVLRSIGKY